MPQHGNTEGGNQSVHQMSMLVGELTGKLEALVRSVDSLNYVWGQREIAATEGRRQLHDKISTMQTDLQRVEASVENMVRDIGQSIKPAIETFKEKAAREDGAARQNKKFYSALALLAGLGGGEAAHFIHKLFGV